MKFEHLVEINDLTNPNIPVITRDQLWRGLIYASGIPKNLRRLYRRMQHYRPH